MGRPAKILSTKRFGNNYAWQNMHGSLLVLPVPSRTDLQQLTGLVAENNGFNLRVSRDDAATLRFLRRHIRHVVYIVKENAPTIRSWAICRLAMGPNANAVSAVGHAEPARHRLQFCGFR